MLNPNEAWKTVGFYAWCQLVPVLVKLEEDVPGSATSRAYRYGFKAGVKLADRDFYEKLNPEHRLN